MEDLKKDGSLKKISIGYTTVPQKYSTPFDYLFDHDAYIYAQLPHGIELPVEHLEKIEAAGNEIDCFGNGKWKVDSISTMVSSIKKASRNCILVKALHLLLNRVKIDINSAFL